MLDWVIIAVGLIYGLIGTHYVARGVRRKLKSVGWEVVQDFKCLNFRII